MVLKERGVSKKISHFVVDIKFSHEKCNAYSKLELVDKIRTDRRCTTLCNYRQERDLLHDSLRSPHTLPHRDPRICCANSSDHVDNLCSKDTRVCRNCMDHQYNHSDRRNLWLHSEIGTERSFRMDWDRKAVVVAPHLVRLWNFK